MWIFYNYTNRTEPFLLFVQLFDNLAFTLTFGQQIKHIFSLIYIPFSPKVSSMIKNTNVSDMLYIIRKWWRIFLIAYSIQTEIGWASSSLDIAAIARTCPMNFFKHSTPVFRSFVNIFLTSTVENDSNSN